MALWFECLFSPSDNPALLFTWIGCIVRLCKPGVILVDLDLLIVIRDGLKVVGKCLTQSVTSRYMQTFSLDLVLELYNSARLNQLT